MLQTLSQLKASSDKAFEALSIPEPAILWKDKLEELKEQKLQRQYERCLMDMRIEQAKTMGFEPFTVAESVEILMGERHSEIKEVVPRQNYEWMYNHHTGVSDCGKDCTWGGIPDDFILSKKEGPWYLPPFCHTKKWTCRSGKLDYLRREVPYGVLLRINELKALKMFNVFSVVAPLEAWEHKTDIDPIILGWIWEIPINDKGVYNTAGDTQAFFIAQW